MSYIDGFVIPVPATKKAEYLALCERVSGLFLACGATRLVEAWGDDVPDGKLTDFKGSVKAEDGEVVVFAWVEWPSKEVRDAGMAKVSEDSSMRDEGYTVPFDGKRMIFGGFATIVDTAADRPA